MKTLILALTASALMLAATHAGAADQPASDPAPQQRPRFELKGIALGDDMEAVKAKLTNPDCETFGDGIAAQCYVEHTTIAEKPAELLVRFLDGKVISVSVTGMTQEDAYAAADALKIKYGQPDYVNEQRYTIVRPKSNRSAIFRVPFWKVTPEDDRLFVEPATYTDKSFTYAAVKLMNLHLHNNIWMAHKNGVAGAANDL